MVLSLLSRVLTVIWLNQRRRPSLIWYWLMRLQGLLLIAPFSVVYILRGIPFSFRCKECHGWITEHQYLRTGVCRLCDRKRIRLDTAGYYVRSGKRYDLANYTKQIPPKGASDLYYSRIAEKVRNGRVLDAGCGPGYELLDLENFPSDTYGIDLAESALQIAKDWLPEANFCLADAVVMPFRSNSFDCVICTAVLEHLDEEQGNAAVRECHRVLKPGGTGLMLVPAGKGIGDAINPEHIQSFTYDGFEKLLCDAGFEIIHGQKLGLYIPFVSPFLELLLRVSRRRLPIPAAFDIEVPSMFAVHFLVECRKPETASS